MTTLLPAAMLAEEVEQILENTSSSMAVWVRTPFMTSCGSATTSLAAPDPAPVFRPPPTGTTHKVMS
jgi:hypothetical protein